MKVAFIHLGKSRPKHLIPNIIKIASEFPELEITLILSEDSTFDRIPEGINIYKYSSSVETEDVFSKFNLDSTFRQGFWRYSLERLFALEAFHAVNPDDSILHIESDILILPDFPFGEIANSMDLMWNSYNDSHDVSAILFSPNFKETKNLLDEVRTALANHPHLSDMTVLNFVRKNSMLKVKLLASYIKELPGLINVHSNVTAREFGEASFSGIFDGAAIGMWLLGHDPRNNYGRYTVHSMGPISNGDSAINPSNIDYEIDSIGRIFLTPVSDSSVKIRLWNLHVHSKELALFGENWVPRLGEYVSLSKNRMEIHRFSIRGLTTLMFDSIYSRTFLKFLYGLPPIHRIRRKISPLLRKLGIRG